MIADFIAAVALILAGLVVCLGSMFVNSYMWFLDNVKNDDPTAAHALTVRIVTIVSGVTFLGGVIILWCGSPALAILFAAFGVFYLRFRTCMQPWLDDDARKRRAGEFDLPEHAPTRGALDDTAP